MKKVILTFIIMASSVGLLSFVVPTGSASAINVYESCKSDASKESAVCKASGTDDASSLIKTVINLLLYVIGIVAVIMIVIGGLKYTTSNGDSAGIKSAKDTILYAIVGLVVALLAFVIVNFVVDAFK